MGYQLYLVHPKAEMLEGEKTFPSLQSLPSIVGGVLVSVPPAEADGVVRDAHQAGINRIWLQQGAASQAAIQYCQENGMNVIHGQCILLYAQPMKFFHKPHRWIVQVLGQLPK